MRSLKEIAKETRETLKKEFPKCKFSVTTEYYSMGQSLHISLMEADFNVILPFDKITEYAKIFYTECQQYKLSDLESLQSKDHHQLNQYTFLEDYDVNKWCNGVFLTEKAHNMFKRVVEVANKDNYDHSDAQTDYFDVGFYLHLNIGKWDKPFKLVKA